VHKSARVFFLSPFQNSLSRHHLTQSHVAAKEQSQWEKKFVIREREREGEGEGEGVILTFPIDSFHLDGEKERKRKGKIVEMSTGERKVDIKRAGPALKRRKCQFNRIHFK
jgi:hypothetical protein